MNDGTHGRQHRLSEIDEETRTAWCAGCQARVDLNRSKQLSWQCGPANRARAQAWRDKPTNSERQRVAALAKYWAGRPERQPKPVKRVVLTPCGQCGKATPNKKFCSRACYFARYSRDTTYATVTCPCGRKFDVLLKRIADGRGKYCSRRCADRFRVRKRSGKPRNANRCTPEYSLRWRLAKFHGMTPDDFDALVTAQGGRCYLCEEPLQLAVRMKVNIDHDWRCCPSGKSCASCRRGLACKRCNLLIGKAVDDPVLLRRIADNLEAALNLLELETVTLESS